MTATDRRFGVYGAAAFKVPCLVATTDDITLSALQTIDGVDLADGDRVLVKDQTDTTENGIYVVSTGPWLRAVDFSGPYDTVKGTLVHVPGDDIYELTTADPVVIGTSGLVFERLIAPFIEDDALIDIVAVPEDRTLLTEENGGWFSNEGASVRPVLTLPLPVSGMTFNLVATFPVGMAFARPVVGVFICRAGVYGVRLSANRAGATCRLVATSETTWMVLDAFPEGAWDISAPSSDDYSDELLAWREEVRLADGEPLTTTMIALDQFIYSEKFYDLWDKTADYALTWKKPSEHEAVALTTLKLFHRVVRYNAPESNDGFGYPLDGASQWLDTGIVPANDAGAIMTSTNQRIALYNTLDVNDNAAAVGVKDGSRNNIIRSRSAGNKMRVTFGGITSDFILSDTTSFGFSVASRTATTVSAWKDGVPLGTATSPTMGSGLPGKSYYIGARNNDGTTDLYLNCSVPYLAIGGRLTDAEEVIAHRNMRRLAAYYGALAVLDAEEE